MGLDYSNFGTVTETGGDQYKQFANLAQNQSGQAFDFGNQAAKYADPFMGERANYKKRLSDLIANPGSQESSPFFKYLMETQMNQVNASNAAGGFRNSGRGLMALQDRAAGVASQAYFPQAYMLSKLAMSGSNPGAAGVSFAYGANRSQDLAQMAAAARAFQPQKPAAPAAPASSLPTMGGNSGGGSTGLSTGGYSGGSYGGQNPRTMSLAQLQAEQASLERARAPGGPSYSPGAGTGYVSTEGGGTTTFNNGVGTYDPYAWMSQETPDYGGDGGYFGNAGATGTTYSPSTDYDPYAFDQTAYDYTDFGSPLSDYGFGEDY